ncbi:hypothetical protein CEXT_475621 [Caerostris extrusa]|uniref:Secreted protein n=1 Tax=Caerostris extrusa TaxID=172846 RepID=A0AAV4YBX6_CAEEX|nr:hypothetical protein CEXT_475621 [Caerostris extrusa]
MKPVTIWQGLYPIFHLFLDLGRVTSHAGARFQVQIPAVYRKVNSPLTLVLSLCIPQTVHCCVRECVKEAVTLYGRAALHLRII